MYVLYYIVVVDTVSTQFTCIQYHTPAWLLWLYPILTSHGEQSYDGVHRSSLPLVLHPCAMLFYQVRLNKFCRLAHTTGRLMLVDGDQSSTHPDTDFIL